MSSLLANSTSICSAQSLILFDGAANRIGNVGAVETQGGRPIGSLGPLHDQSLAVGHRHGEDMVGVAYQCLGNRLGFMGAEIDADLVS